MRKKKIGKKRDLIAKDLMTNKYRQRIIQNKKKKVNYKVKKQSHTRMYGIVFLLISLYFL